MPAVVYVKSNQIFLSADQFSCFQYFICTTQLPSFVDFIWLALIVLGAKLCAVGTSWCIKSKAEFICFPRLLLSSIQQGVLCTKYPNNIKINSAQHQLTLTKALKALKTMELFQQGFIRGYQFAKWSQHRQPLGGNCLAETAGTHKTSHCQTVRDFGGLVGGTTTHRMIRRKTLCNFFHFPNKLYLQRGTQACASLAPQTSALYDPPRNMLHSLGN